MAQQWSENLKFDPELVLDCNTFNQWVLSAVPMVEKMTPAKHPKWLNDPHSTKIPVGDHIFYVREIPPTIKKHRYGGGYFFDPPHGPLYDAPVRLETHYGGKPGYVQWDGPVLVPILTTPDGSPNGKVWMSLTPMEVFSQRQGIGVAKGNVLIGGLGMGWFARRVLEKKTVKHVTIADTDKAILEFFGKPLQEEFGDRLTLVQSDVYKVPREYDSYLIDIWPCFGDCEYDKKFIKLAVEEKGVWGWGPGWRAKVQQAKRGAMVFGERSELLL